MLFVHDSYDDWYYCKNNKVSWKKIVIQGMVAISDIVKGMLAEGLGKHP